MLTTEVENYPGFPDGIMGPELMIKFREQAQRFGAEFLTEKVDRGRLQRAPVHGLGRATQRVHRPTPIIVSHRRAEPDARPRRREPRLLGHGLSTCATCDGFFFRGQEIAVVGGGDSAVEEATFLTKFATKVTMIHRRDALRASKIMQDRALSNPKIEMLWNTVVDDLRRRRQARGRRRPQRAAPARRSTLPVTGLFVAIGHRPNTDLFKGVLDMEDNGYLVTRPGLDLHQRRRRVRLRRRAGPHLPPGHHRRRLGLHGRHRRRALARGQQHG